MEGVKKYLVSETNDQNLTKSFKNLKTIIQIDWNQKRIFFKAGNSYRGKFELEGNMIKMGILGGTKMMWTGEDVQAVEGFMIRFFRDLIDFEIQGNKITFLKGGEELVCKVE